MPTAAVGALNTSDPIPQWHPSPALSEPDPWRSQACPEPAHCRRSQHHHQRPQWQDPADPRPDRNRWQSDHRPRSEHLQLRHVPGPRHLRGSRLANQAGQELIASSKKLSKGRSERGGLSSCPRQSHRIAQSILNVNARTTKAKTTAHRLSTVHYPLSTKAGCRLHCSLFIVNC